jgi:hypothetical protein
VGERIHRLYDPDGGSGQERQKNHCIENQQGNGEKGNVAGQHPPAWAHPPPGGVFIGGPWYYPHHPLAEPLCVLGSDERMTMK